MGCKNLRVRSRKYIKYFYCKINKKEITLELCKDCENKDYVKRTEIKGKKHKQTKATEISKTVKETVWYRDRRKCIFCGQPLPLFYANAHLIPRSAGGMRYRRKHIYSVRQMPFWAR